MEAEPEVTRIGMRDGKVAFVKYDRCYSNLIKSESWYLNKGGYAVSSNRILMHRMVVSLRGENIEGLIVDHINGDRLDNRSSNLRVTTSKGNAKNRHNDPIYDGLVGVRKGTRQYHTVHRNVICFSHDDPKMCALCYDSVVTFCYGPGKRLNDNISLKPLEISFWNLDEVVMSKLSKIKESYTDFKGVKKMKEGWRASVTIELGIFDTPEEAAKAHDEALKILKKDIKSTELNFP